MSFPLIGTVEVAGKTPGQIETILEDLFRGRFIKNPQITVNLKEIISQTVTIGGEVKEPGVYPVVGKMTLMRAVATAKGTTEFSKKNEVVIFRTINGSEYAAIYDMRAIQRGNYSDPEVFANDIVMVGDSSARRVFKDFLTASPLIAPLFYLLNNNN
jgi:polysaccharide export outer membrane protein